MIVTCALMPRPRRPAAFAPCSLLPAAWLFSPALLQGDLGQDHKIIARPAVHYRPVQL
jgi:hypothetical protein